MDVERKHLKYLSIIVFFSLKVNESKAAMFLVYFSISWIYISI